MSTSEDIRELESELEDRKSDLREDAAQISGKIEETKAKLSPMNLARERPFLVVGAGLFLGFALGYLLVRRKLPVRAEAQSAIEHVAKPMARGFLTSAGRQAPVRAIRGR